MMNSKPIFVSLIIVFVISSFVLPNTVNAKISFCASGDTLYQDDVFQCFVKENDCKAFADNNLGTKCIKSKS